MKKVFKENVGVSNTKFKDTDLLKLMKEAWDRGDTKAEMARNLRTERISVYKVTKDWTRDYVKPSKRRKFDYNIAYCLLFEHVLTYKETAQALEVKEPSLRQIMRVNKKKIEEGHATWKIWYECQRRKSLPRNLYDRSTAQKVVWDKLSPEKKKQKVANLRSVLGRPKGLVYEKVQCPHCLKIGGGTKMKSHHFDNCR